MSAVICGIDEAGRGPLAGSLFVAGCILTGRVEGLNDSKKLSPTKRELLRGKIVQNSFYYIAARDCKEVDALGISACLKSALLEIMGSLRADKYIFDGNSAYGVKGIETLVKADAQIIEVMAASILAKTAKDEEALELDALFPQYGFAAHKGYGVAKHIEAIKRFGLCEAHRKSFKPKALQESLF